MKKLTIKFAGYGLQDEPIIHGCETSAELLGRVAGNILEYTDIPLFDYETGTLWEVVDETEEDKRIAELEAKLEEVQGQYAYECECNKQFVECQKQNEQLKAENERLKKECYCNFDGKHSYKDLYIKAEEWGNKLREDLQQQLKEKNKLLNCYKDEEIKIAKILGDKDLTIIGSRVHLENLINDYNKRLESSTKQVCEKIRNELIKDDYLLYGETKKAIINLYLETLDKILDQIERGEK